MLKNLKSIGLTKECKGQIIIFLLLFLSSAFPSAVFADILINGPGTLNQAGATYSLTQDINASGTAFTITASDITLDLGGHTVVYNTSPSASSVYGVYVNVLINHITIRNGVIIQGAGSSSNSPAIYIYGGTNTGNHTISNLAIKVYGYQSNGIQADNSYGFNNSEISHVYIEVHGDTTALDGYGSDPITIGANTGGIQIHDNVLAAGHRGMYVTSVNSGGAPNQSRIYNNKIQQVRRKGSKAPYGILAGGKSHNIDIYDNQIISDDGRGINMDGWGMGVSSGASGNHIYRNRIDVSYSSAATTGGYVENNVYGIRDRYASGDNLFEDNTIIVSSDIDGDVYGFYIGSDGSDSLMKNIVARNNTIIARRGLSSNTPFVFRFDYADSVSIIDNLYTTEGGFTTGTNLVTSLIISNNTALTPPATTPVAPTGLNIAKCFDSYSLKWDKNTEADVFEYIVYRDGVKLPISPRGGTFFVDIGAGGSHVYAISALTLSGVEGPKSADVSTTTSAACLDSIADTNAPTVQITQPTSSSTYTTTNTTIPLSGNANDSGGTKIGIASVTWSNNATGGSGNCTVSGNTNPYNWDCGSISIASGQNTITVTATDGDNNIGIDILIANVTTSGDGGNTGGNNGGDASGGSGCGFVRDDNGKGQGAKGEGVSLIIMLIISLMGIALLKRFSMK